MANETNVTISPVLHYRDLEAGIRFLTEAVGFREHALHKGPDGEIQYAELELGGAGLGVGRSAGGDSPYELGPTAIYVGLDDPDSLFERVAASGAEIVAELTDREYGSREFSARDPEKNVWCFGTYRAGAAS